jgi:hypothetical protein
MLREGHKLTVFKEVQQKIFGPKTDEVTGDWERLHNEELYDVQSSPNIIRVIRSRRMKWAGHVANMGGRRNAYRVLVDRPDEKRSLGRPKHRWEDNIKVDLQVGGWGGMDLIALAQNRDRQLTPVNVVMNLQVS